MVVETSFSYCSTTRLANHAAPTFDKVPWTNGQLTLHAEPVTEAIQWLVAQLHAESSKREALERRLTAQESVSCGSGGDCKDTGHDVSIAASGSDELSALGRRVRRLESDFAFQKDNAVEQARVSSSLSELRMDALLKEVNATSVAEARAAAPAAAAAEAANLSTRLEEVCAALGSQLSLLEQRLGNLTELQGAQEEKLAGIHVAAVARVQSGPTTPGSTRGASRASSAGGSGINTSRNAHSPSVSPDVHVADGQIGLDADSTSVGPDVHVADGQIALPAWPVMPNGSRMELPGGCDDRSQGRLDTAETTAGASDDRSQGKPDIAEGMTDWIVQQLHALKAELLHLGQSLPQGDNLSAAECTQGAVSNPHSLATIAETRRQCSQVGDLGNMETVQPVAVSVAKCTQGATSNPHSAPTTAATRKQRGNGGEPRHADRQVLTGDGTIQDTRPNSDSVSANYLHKIEGSLLNTPALTDEWVQELRRSLLLELRGQAAGQTLAMPSLTDSSIQELRILILTDIQYQSARAAEVPGATNQQMQDLRASFWDDIEALVARKMHNHVYAEPAPLSISKGVNEVLESVTSTMQEAISKQQVVSASGQDLTAGRDFPAVEVAAKHLQDHMRPWIEALQELQHRFATLAEPHDASAWNEVQQRLKVLEGSLNSQDSSDWAELKQRLKALEANTPAGSQAKPASLNCQDSSEWEDVKQRLKALEVNTLAGSQAKPASLNCQGSSDCEEVKQRPLARSQAKPALSQVPTLVDSVVRDSLTKLELRVKTLEHSQSMTGGDMGMQASFHGDDAKHELANISHALRGVQRAADMTNAKLEDVVLDQKRLRTHVDVALPHFLHALKVLADSEGFAPEVCSKGHEALSSQDRVGSNVLNAAEVALETLGKLLSSSNPTLFVSPDSLDSAMGALEQNLRALIGGMQQRLNGVQDEAAGKADRNDIQSIAAKLNALEQHAASTSAILEGCVGEDATKNPAGVRWPLQPARCISCNAKADLVGPWERKAVNKPSWPNGRHGVVDSPVMGSRGKRSDGRDGSLPALER